MAALMMLLAGLIFALGLGISGMTRPDKVVGFLDVTGAWQPDLAFVMGGAVVVNVVALRLTLRRRAPIFGTHFGIPQRSDFDARLVGGAGLFGIGWGLGGFCPGPALASVITGATPVLIFIGAMLAGMVGFDLLQRIGAQPDGVVDG